MSDSVNTDPVEYDNTPDLDNDPVVYGEVDDTEHTALEGAHVNEHLPEDHRDRVTAFGDIRDEEHMPPGNPVGAPTPTQRELQEANLVVEEKRGTTRENEYYDEQGDDEDLIHRPHQGASSWVSDPDAVSSDVTQRNQPGYGVEGGEVTGLNTDGTVSLGERASSDNSDETSYTPESGLSPDNTSDTPDANPEQYDATQHTVAEVEAYAKNHPDQVATLLNQEQVSGNPRSSLISKLETMRME